MCGIVGLFLKDHSYQPKLGGMLSNMLVTLSDRGPDSAGIAIYRNESNHPIKFTLQSVKPDEDFSYLITNMVPEFGPKTELRINKNHAVLYVPGTDPTKVRQWLQDYRASIKIMSVGEYIEIYKEVGLPKSVIREFNIPSMFGSHGIAHTRMATESIVNTLGAHPFSTGLDQCLVHNGSLSNHNSLRKKLENEGMAFETENDTEVGAAYLSWKMKSGLTLEEALNDALLDLDGFYNFVVGTRNGFGVLRDPVACKPAVMAENEQYVAFGSEYRALAVLPNIDQADIWEPEPATVYFWNNNK